ncbi:MAG: porin [Tepidisphaeraceae bacterium]|jgi:hypothetical protein
MFSAKHCLLPALMACAIGVGIGTARGADPSSQQLQQKVDQLEAKVASLEANQNQTAAAAAQQVVSEADKHSMLMGSVPTGTGYDQATGFHIASDDGNFFFHPWSLVQFRAVANYRDSLNDATGSGADAPATGDDTESGFEIRRFQLGIDGHIYTPNLNYCLMLEADRSGGSVSLQDAYVTYRLGNTSCWSIKGGQFEDIAWHETNVDDAHQLAAERSMVSALIGGTITGPFGGAVERVQGITVLYQQGNLHAEAGYHDGYATANTKFFDTSILPGVQENFGVSGRVEYKLMGDQVAWDEYKQFTAMDAKSDALIVGGGVDWTQAGSNDGLWYTVDAQYDNPNGLSAYAAFLGMFAHSPKGITELLPSGDYSNCGFLVQAGYMINRQWEPFVRYDYTSLKGEFGNAFYGSEHSVHELTAGVNYYFYGQRARVTLDGTYLPNGSPVDADGLGDLTDNGHAQFIARLQLQLLI